MLKIYCYMDLGNRFLTSFICFLLLRTCSPTDTLTVNRPIKDGDVLVSQEEIFALGFFSPGRSVKRYVGIWYCKVLQQTVVWVANRDNPVTDTSGVLSIDNNDGNLVLYSRKDNMVHWSTNVSTAAPATNTSSVFAQLLVTGNLVLFRGNSIQDVVWQSFDYPTNTMLPDMKIGVDKRTGQYRFLSSWKSAEDPGRGDYTCKINLRGKPQLFIYKGFEPVWRVGTWDGLKLNGVPEMAAKFVYDYRYVENSDEVYLADITKNASVFFRMVINESGILERSIWQEGDKRWVTYLSLPKEQCDYFSHCGAFGYCDQYMDPVSFECQCLPGFEPKLATDWFLRDGSKGCVRKQGARICTEGEGFLKLANTKIPDTSTALVDMSMGLEDCKELCLKNCSCTGFSNADISHGGSGCITWYGDMIDARRFSDSGQDLHVRVDAINLAQHSKNSRSFHGKYVVAILCSAAMLLVTLSLLYCWVMKRKKDRSALDNSSSRTEDIHQTDTNANVLFFHLRTIVAATDNFSPNNKLGEGGFGPVFKGMLKTGQEIAVKRLSQNSRQGIKEFKNEVTLIAKLQHRNLVKLLGYCIEKEEKMLIYEYLPNKGLDGFIFDKTKASELEWRRRFEIITGIVRGMIYLHQDSRLKIIHRDLKANNVLLDANMKPKISDFGMARIFRVDQIEDNTNQVVGTLGYMSPEYAMEGQFSIKSDVFSFGVVLLEIITGRKNNSYCQEKTTLVGHIWDMWRQDKSLEVVDSSMGDSYQAEEVLRCIQIGLLCVQELAIDRPAMPEVASMLSNKMPLPSPNQPAFIFNKRAISVPCTSSSRVECNSANQVTITSVQGR